MRVYNPPAPAALNPQFAVALAELRARRDFDAAVYAQAKAAMLNDYMAEHRLAACVVAVSGGVDSAVVLGLVALAARQPDSPIKQIVAALAPVFDDEAATHQDDALARGRLVAQACGVTASVIDLTAAHRALKSAVDDALGVTGQGWASGQLVAYARTPAFYYVTSLLAQQGTPGILVGTTNRDEGAYLGYVGKAADGMVDVQVIADLHKSEVLALAAHLGLPDEVITTAPTGDMYDGRADEEVFGAPYDFVELYLGWLSAADRDALTAGWKVATFRDFWQLADRLEALHAYNAHKYLAASPAVHLNLLPSAVPGGWER